MIKQLKLFSVCFILFSLFFINDEFVHADEEYRLEIEVDAGLNGIARQYKGFPVTLTITNHKQDFSGDLVITIPRDHGSIGNKVIPINIAANSTKVIQFSVPGLFGMDTLRLGPNQTRTELFHLYEGEWQEGNEVQIDSSLDLSATYIQENRAVIGVLTDNPDSLNYLKLTSFSGQSPELIFLNSEHLPNEAQGLQVLDLLVINNFSVASLSEEVQNAIEQWIYRGGNLVVGSKPGLQQEFGKLSDALPLQITDTTTVHDVASFNGLSEATFSVKQFEIFSGEIKENVGVLLKEKDIPLIIKQYIGNGSVTQLAFDPSHSGFPSWLGVDELWDEITGKSIRTGMKQNHPSRLGNELSSVALNFPALGNFKMSTLSILFVVYLVLIVFVLYFVLKKMDRREWTWIIIPTFAIITSVGIYLVGAKDRLGSIQTNAVSVISVDQQGLGSGYGSIAFLSKDSGDYQLSIDKQLNPFPASGYRYNERSLSNIPMIQPANENTNVTFRDVEFWTPRSVFVDIPVKEYGKFHTNLTLKDNTITGTVSNKFPYDFEEVYLISGRNYESIGSLSVGETKEITFDTKNQGFLQGPTERVAFEIYQPTGPIQDREEERKLELMTTAFRNQQTNLSTPILVGFTENSVFTSSVNEEETAQEDLHLFTQPVTIHLPANKSVQVSTELTRPELSVVDGRIHFNGTTRGEPFFDGEPGSYELTYVLPPSLVEKKYIVNELTVSFQERSNGMSYSIFSTVKDDFIPIEGKQISFTKKVDETYVQNNEVVIQVNTGGRIQGPIFVPNLLIEGVTSP